MHYLGFGVFAIVLIGALWLMARGMTAGGRNDADKHGGGLDDPGTRSESHTTDNAGDI